MINFNEIVQIIISKGYVAEIREITKDGCVREAISIAKPDMLLSPVIYLDTIDFSKLTGPETIANYLISLAEPHFVEDEIDLDFISDWDKVKSKLYVCMGYRCNFTGAVFTKPFLSDIIQYIRIMVSDITPVDNGSIASITVTNEIANQWKKEFNLSTDEIFAVATANSQDSYIVEDILTALGVDSEICPVEMLILSNKDKYFGASVLTCTNLLNKVSDTLGGGDFYIVPSSVHEVLALRPKDDVNAELLRPMVQQVNVNELTQKEILSYSVYFYERASETVKQAG
jgi:hypothetical protein